VAPNNDRSQLESGGSSLRLETPSYKAGSFETNVCQFQFAGARSSVTTPWRRLSDRKSPESVAEPQGSVVDNCP
jgi:hypothetical protein